MRFVLPLVVLAALIALFWVGLQRDPRELPSPLIGKPAPNFELQDLATPDDAMKPAPLIGKHLLIGKPHLVNFFASWCAGCQIEHPFLMQLAKEKAVSLVGIDYKDARTDARRWLGERGNPYNSVLFDLEGQVGIDWGVYGVPETFVVDARGVIVHKHVGPLTPEAWARIKPMLGQAAGASR